MTMISTNVFMCCLRWCTVSHFLPVIFWLQQCQVLYLQNDLFTPQRMLDFEHDSCTQLPLILW